ncbi:CAP domain-containing protein [Strongyloides ratti]|uniref:CAP domain-containing protein n=1 Tax=Strongyloides ratti TaxID=34506 RepID=A0A090LFD2_STRRB|nr:CAP domain-containing protein [Strongyloides ratti]CEF66858.1 CAP domain-containing protein [Strongyloides ratti]
MNTFIKIIISIAIIGGLTSAAVNVEELRKYYLQETNKYRVLHQVPQVVVNATIQKGAQDWANYLANTVKGLKHSSSGFGENLAYASSSIAKNAVKMWYDEVQYYDFSKQGFTSKTGHFTQLVWKNSKQVGFGITEKNGIVYVVCRYSPPGNYLGQFEKNVFPAKK